MTLRPLLIGDTLSKQAQAQLVFQNTPHSDMSSSRSLPIFNPPPRIRRKAASLDDLKRMSSSSPLLPPSPSSFLPFDEFRLQQATENTLKRNGAQLPTKRWHALMELIETEVAYLADLRVLVKVYLQQLVSVSVITSEARTVISRNAEELLHFHKDFTAGILQIGSLLSDNQDTRLETIINLIATKFIEQNHQFSIYESYCSGHLEALDILRRVQSRPEWEWYEKRCATLATDSQSVGHISRRHSSDSMSQPHSRLTLLDFLIKPVQRICKYPLILVQLQDRKDSNQETIVGRAVDVMKNVAMKVDEARRQKDVAMKRKLIQERLATDQVIWPEFLASLGNCILAGSLDVIYHHPLFAPLDGSVKVRYLGAFLYAGWMVLAKVFKGKIYEPKHWFPLAALVVIDLGEGDSILPCSFRLSCGSHHFELAAACAKEKEFWISAITRSIDHPLSAACDLPTILPNSSSVYLTPCNADSCSVFGVNGVPHRQELFFREPEEGILDEPGPSHGVEGEAGALRKTGRNKSWDSNSVYSSKKTISIVSAASDEPDPLKPDRQINDVHISTPPAKSHSQASIFSSPKRNPDGYKDDSEFGVARKFWNKREPDESLAWLHLTPTRKSTKRNSTPGSVTPIRYSSVASSSTLPNLSAILIRRSSAAQRIQVDRGLVDVFSEECLLARAHIQGSEQLFPPAKSVSGSATGIGVNMSISNTFGMGRRLGSVRAVRKRSLMEDEDLGNVSGGPKDAQGSMSSKFSMTRRRSMAFVGDIGNGLMQAAAIVPSKSRTKSQKSKRSTQNMSISSQTTIFGENITASNPAREGANTSVLALRETSLRFASSSPTCGDSPCRARDSALVERRIPREGDGTREGDSQEKMQHPGNRGRGNYRADLSSSPRTKRVDKDKDLPPDPRRRRPHSHSRSLTSIKDLNLSGHTEEMSSGRFLRREKSKMRPNIMIRPPIPVPPLPASEPASPHTIITPATPIFSDNPSWQSLPRTNQANLRNRTRKMNQLEPRGQSSAASTSSSSEPTSPLFPRPVYAVGRGLSNIQPRPEREGIFVRSLSRARRRVRSSPGTPSFENPSGNMLGVPVDPSSISLPRETREDRVWTLAGFIPRSMLRARSDPMQSKSLRRTSSRSSSELQECLSSWQFVEVPTEPVSYDISPRSLFPAPTSYDMAIPSIRNQKKRLKLDLISNITSDAAKFYQIDGNPSIGGVGQTTPDTRRPEALAASHPPNSNASSSTSSSTSVSPSAPTSSTSQSALSGSKRTSRFMQKISVLNPLVTAKQS